MPWYLFLYFFHNIGPNFVQRPSYFDFFAGFQWNMLGIQSILITLIGIQQFWKKIDKTPESFQFLAQLVEKWGPHGSQPKPKNIFFLQK